MQYSLFLSPPIRRVRQPARRDAACKHGPDTWRSFMPHLLSPTVFGRFAGFVWVGLSLLACLTASGCKHDEKVDFTTVSTPPTVQVINPPVRNIVRVVGQPSFIEAYETHVDLSQADRLHRKVER